MIAGPVVALSLLEFAVAVTASVVALVAWRYRGTRASRPLIVMAVGTSLYALSTAVMSFVTDPFWWRLLNNVGYPLGAAIAVGSFFVVVEFTERDRLRDRRVLVALAGFVVFDLVAAMTDPLHNQVITGQRTVDGVLVGTAGPLFWVHTIVSLGIVCVAVGLCLSTFLTSSGIYRKQSLTILGAFGVGITGFAWQSVAPVHPALDLATVGMVGWCGIILWGVFVADFFEIIPVGRERVVENIDDPVIILNGDDCVLDCNPAARALVDIPSDWYGIPVAAFFEPYPPLVEQIRERTPGAVTVDQDGATRQFDVTVSAVDDGEQHETDAGHTQSAVVILRDVTEQYAYRRDLERSRERYRSLFENSPLVLWEQDLSAAISRARTLAEDGQALVSYLEANPEEHRQLFGHVEVLDVNEVAVEAYGAESKTELVDRMDELFVEQSLATNRELLGRLVEGDRQFRSETTYRTLDGDTRHELVEVFVPDPYVEDCSRVLIAGTDITDRKQRERQLQRQNELLDEFASVVSHDVATPLGVIENKARLIEMTGDTGHAEDIYSASQRVQRLVDELRELAREGNDVGDTAPVDLGAVVEEAWASVESPGATLDVAATTTVEADRARLRQLLENLAENAVEHGSTSNRTQSDDTVENGSTGNGGQSDDAVGEAANGDGLTVAVGTVDGGFYVADDGAGLPADIDDIVFEQGYTTDEDNTGLGLAIVRRIAEGHGWDIDVTESESGGARFEIRTG